MEGNRGVSIYNLRPLEVGGVEARQGFQIQDHVAAGFCIEMLSRAELIEVWCETQDDITLIWQEDGGKCVEFVQVKSNELNQLWSIAELCKREKGKVNKKVGSSIIERSLAYDRCREPCCFRIVTCRPVMTELEGLTLPIDSEQRAAKGEDLNQLKGRVEEKVGDFRSPNDNGPSYWVDKTKWDVRHSEQGIKDANLILQRYLGFQNATTYR